MRIAIIGAGAMGSLFGAMLSPVSDVFLVDPFLEHVSAINKNGLFVEKTDGTTKKYRLFAVTNPDQINHKVDLAVIFTKSYMTEDAACTAESLLDKNGLAVTLQNGLGNREIIAKIIGTRRVVAGVTSHGGTLLKPGYIRHAGCGPTYLAGPCQSNQSINHIIEVFNAAGIDTTLSENLDSLIWGKLIINAGINALTAILRVPNGILTGFPESEKIMQNTVLEAAAVAKALGIKLPYDNPVQEVKKVCENTAVNRSSMLQDILRGARTEIGVINRAIEAKGKELGIPTVYNTFLSEIIEALEATSKNRC